MTELVMDRRIVWDSKNLKEIDEAKSTIMSFKRQGYPIFTTSGKPMEKFLPSLEEVVILAKNTTKNRVLKILNEKGDERIVWDRENGSEAKEAKAKFEEFVKKGYKAYSVNSQGNKNRMIEEFDVDSEEILMVPKTAKG